MLSFGLFVDLVVHLLALVPLTKDSLIWIIFPFGKITFPEEHQSLRSIASIASFGLVVVIFVNAIKYLLLRELDLLSFFHRVVGFHQSYSGEGPARTTKSLISDRCDYVLLTPVDRAWNIARFDDWVV